MRHEHRRLRSAALVLVACATAMTAGAGTPAMHASASTIYYDGFDNLGPGCPGYAGGWYGVLSGSWNVAPDGIAPAGCTGTLRWQYTQPKTDALFLWELRTRGRTGHCYPSVYVGKNDATADPAYYDVYTNSGKQYDGHFTIYQITWSGWESAPAPQGGWPVSGGTLSIVLENGGPTYSSGLRLEAAAAPVAFNCATQ